MAYKSRLPESKLAGAKEIEEIFLCNLVQFGVHHLHNKLGIPENACNFSSETVETEGSLRGAGF